MALHGPVDHLEPPQVKAVRALVERLPGDIRHAPLGDAAWERLALGGRGFAAAWADAGDGPGDEPVAYAQATFVAAEEQWVVDLILDPDHQGRLADLGAPLLRRVLGSSEDHMHYWVSDPTPAHHELVSRLGLFPHRVLHQMRAPLPLDGPPATLPTRAFRVGEDEEALLEVNRRAFATHPDQGRMTRAQLDDRVAQPWFDPAGCLLHEIDGRLAGFCWTKLFTDFDPPRGEIHIIGVDPDFAGRGLGPQLVRAGLQHLAGVGAGEGVLFVEGDNEPALRLYDKLGFRITRTDHAFSTSDHE